MNASEPAPHDHIIELEGRPIRYDDVGAGPTLVFVHGVWATGGVWDAVVARLSRHYRCIVPTLPLGVHRFASPPDVDRSPQALVRVITGLLDALDLHDVTLVGNDTGGALCQLLIAGEAPRIGRLVLTNCDAFEVFPPRVLAPLYAAARMPALWWCIAQLTRLPRLRRRFWSLVAHAEPDRALLDMLLDRFAFDAGVREDLRQTICAIDRSQTIAAARTFGSFDRDVLVLWGSDDVFFPLALGRRLAAAFPRATLEVVESAMLFVMVDAPDAVADAIARFARREDSAAPVLTAGGARWENGA
jgi:pimeloyl-ACP methyl ester carboxylesterase